MKAKPVLLFPLKIPLNKQLVWCLLILVFSTFPVISQISPETIPVLQALKEVEKSFDVKFSYIRKDLKKNINMLRYYTVADMTVKEFY